MKKMIYVMLLCVLALSLVGCNSEIDSTGEDTQVNEEQNTPEVTSPKEVAEDEKDTDEGVTYEDFKSRLQDNPKYHVEYELTYSNGQKENVVIYTKNDKTRMEIEDDEEPIIVWMNGESVIEFEGQCVDLSTASQFGFDPESIYKMTSVEGTVKTDEKSLDISSVGTKTMAGKTTNCYEITYKTDSINDLTTYCLTDTGIPALLKTVDKNTGEMRSEAKAITLEDSVSDNVLEPCEPNMDLSGLI